MQTDADYSVLFDKLLHSAPPHFLETVISELDCHSIRALLLAVPQLRHSAVILRSAHMSNSSQFFRIADVPVLSLESVLLQDEVVPDRCFIRLIEHADTMGTLQPLPKRLYHQKSTKFVLNSCSFVHLAGVLAIPVVNSLLETGCGRRLCLHIGSDYSGYDIPEETVRQYYETWIEPLCGESYSLDQYVQNIVSRVDSRGPKNNPQRAPWDKLIRWSLFTSDVNPDRPYHWRGIKELSISNTMVVENLRLQRLSKLDITFYKDMDGRIPIVRAIEAPALIAFRVDFPGGRVPLFYDVSVGAYCSINAHFSLCNPQALDPHSLVKDTWTTTEDYTKMNLSFTSNFDCLMFSGVPDCLVHKADMGHTKEVVWFKTVDFKLMCPVNRDAVLLSLKLRSLMLVCSIPDSWAPRFEAPRYELVGEALYNMSKRPDIELQYGPVYILTTAPRFDLNGLLETDVLWKTAMSISVTCRLPDEELNDPSNAIVLSHGTLKKLVSHPGPLDSVSFRGCLFGRDNELLSTPIRPAEPMYWPGPIPGFGDEETRIQSLSIEFVITDQRETLVFECFQWASIGIRELHVGHDDVRDTSPRGKTLQITLPDGEAGLEVVDGAEMHTGFSGVRVRATVA